MLHDDCGGPLEFPGKRQGRFQVHQIVVGKLLALQLPRRGEARNAGPHRNVQSGALVRILAVAQFLPARESEMQPRGQHRALAEFSRSVCGGEAFELRSNIAVIARGQGERLARQLQPRREVHLALCFDFGGDGGIVGRVGHHRDAFKIFCG